MTHQNNEINKIGAEGPPPILFPKGVLSVSREEFYGQDDDHQPLALIVRKVRREAVVNSGVSTSRAEFLDDRFWEGDRENASPLPEDLQGHVFIVGIAGSFDSPEVKGDPNIIIPTGDGWQHMFSGDGIVYRLSLNTPPTEGAFLASRIVKTPDYYVDLHLEGCAREVYLKKSQENSQEQLDFFLKYSQFRDAAITRISPFLGSRQYLNTAFLKLSPLGSQSGRLLLTWDSGRPYEIDPVTLGLVAPVGFNEDWFSMFEINQLTQLFKLIPFFSGTFPIDSQIFPLLLATAHPAYDPHDDTVFMVNATKSLKNIFQISKVFPNFEREVRRLFGSKWLENLIVTTSLCVVRILLNIFLGILKFLGIGGRDHLYLYRWKGDQTAIGDDDRWEVVQANGSPIAISQTLHQMALTRDYIVISDSSFKLVLADIIPSLLNPKDFGRNFRRVLQVFRGISSQRERFHAMPQPATPEKSLQEYLQFIFRYLNYPQTPYTDLYIVPRPDRQPKTDTAAPSAQNSRKNPPKIRAKRVRLFPETAHFVVDYDDSGDRIVLNAGHISASDPAEYIHLVDKSVDHYDAASQQVETSENKNLTERAGVLVNSMDVNSIVSWVIDVAQETIEPQFSAVADPELLWFLAFYTYNDQPSEHLTDIYWNCGGLWSERLTDYYLELYQNRPGEKRTIDLETLINQFCQSGKPANLLHLKQSVVGDCPQLSLVDSYIFPEGYFASSPQFVPRKGREKEPDHGYIACIVNATDNYRTDVGTNSKFCEFWIFEAENLAQGPLYRLNHPRMNIGFTLHTTWLHNLASPPTRKDYSVKADFEKMLDDIEPEDYKTIIQEIFKQEVYSRFDD
jgi:Retinal pigment epithelial membrane protein